MHSENREVEAATKAIALAEWVRPDVRRLEAGMAEGSTGTGPVDAVFAS